MTAPQVATVTNIGLQAALDAQVNGIKVNVTSFKIGSAVGFVPSVTDTDVHNSVYSGITGQLTYRVDGPNKVVYRVALDSSVGDFAIGNIGLFLETGELFALVVLPSATTKVRNALPNTVGNTKIFDILITFANLGTNIEFDLEETLPASIPQVANEDALPDPSSAPFNLYVVESNSLYSGNPTFAYSDGDEWEYLLIGPLNFSLYKESFQEGSTLPFISTSAINSVAIGRAAAISGASEDCIVLNPANVEGLSSLVGMVGSNANSQKTTGNYLVVLGFANIGGNSLAHQFNLVIGGSNNLVTAVAGSICGGRYNQVTADYGSVLGGSYALADLRGEQAFAVGRFTNNGDAQVSRYILRATTTNNSQVEALIDGLDRLVLLDNETWFYKVRVVARRTDSNNESGAWELTGAVDRFTDNASVYMVQEPIVDIIAADRPNWTVALSADQTYGALRVLVTGENGRTIRWVAYVEAVQVRN